MKRRAAKEWIDRHLADLSQSVPLVDLRKHASDISSRAWRSAPPVAPRPRAPHARLLVVALVPVAALVAIWLGAGAHRSDTESAQREVASASGGSPEVVGREGDRAVTAPGSSRNAVAPAPEPYARVVGQTALLVDAAGPLLRFTDHEEVPLGVPLRVEGTEAGVLRIGGRADVVLDPTARLIIEPPAKTDCLSLVAGRISLQVAATHRPLRVRLPEAGSELETDAASFGALASAGRRWALAVQSGEVRIIAPPPTRVVGPGTEAGGLGGEAPIIRATSAAVKVHVAAVPRGHDWTIEGLADVLARVEVDGREVAVDAKGQFRVPRGTNPRPVRVATLDALGRRSEKVVRWPAVPPNRPAPKPVEGEVDDGFRVKKPRW